MLAFVPLQMRLSGISLDEMSFKLISSSSLKQSKWELPFRYQQFEKFGRTILLLLRETM